jgi:hypothetical protein
MNPIPRNDQSAREALLRKVGIDPSNQQLAVATLAQLQRVAIARCDEACVYYLRKWVKELRGLKPKSYTKRLGELNANFSALFKTTDKLSGSNSLTYGLARKHPDGLIEKHAFEITYKVTPQLNGKGIFSLAVDHKEIAWPSNVSIKES